MAFLAAPEYQVFPTRERPMTPVRGGRPRGAGDASRRCEAFAPDVAVADILTAAPALAAELCGVPVATLVPHVHPWPPPGAPPFSIGARRPRTRAGARAWRAFDPAVAHGPRARPRASTTRRAGGSGLGPLPHLHTALSRSLTLVGDAARTSSTRAAGRPGCGSSGRCCGSRPGEPAAPPPGDGPVVLLAPSTSQDPEEALLRAALAGLGGAPVRVLASTNGRDPGGSPRRRNARLVPWLSYAQTMPACDVVVCHGGHGTLARALCSGCAVGGLPGRGRHGGERGARRLGRTRRPPAPAACSPRARSGWRSSGRSATSACGRAPRAVAAWAGAHDGPATAAREIEAWAERA